MTERTCSVESCESRSYCRGLCTRHYQRQRATGTTEPSKHAHADRPNDARLLALIDVRGPDDCWPWLGGKTATGYGAPGSLPGLPRTTAHRAVYLVFVGPVPDGHEVDHLCHDPAQCTLGDACPHRACCNPQHLDAVPARVNTMRSNGVGALNALKTTCPRGHRYSGTSRSGRRICHPCAADWMRESRRIRRESSTVV